MMPPPLWTVTYADVATRNKGDGALTIDGQTSYVERIATRDLEALLAELRSPSS